MEEKEYLLKKIPEDLWQKVKIKAIQEDVVIRDVIIQLLREWVGGKVNIEVIKGPSRGRPRSGR